MPPTKKVAKFIKNNNYLNITYKTDIHVFFFIHYKMEMFLTQIYVVYTITTIKIFTCLYIKKV